MFKRILSKSLNLIMIMAMLFASLPMGGVQAQSSIEAFIPVTTEAELRTALLGSNIISISNDITGISAPLVITQPNTTIIGNSKTLSFSGLEAITSGEDDGIIITANDVTLSALTVNANLPAPATWVGTYAIHAYNVTNAALTSVTAKGANGGILVNGSTVTLASAINVSGNGFGGIESSRGSGLPNNPALNVSSATFTNESEAYGLPTIWEDGVTGTVTTATGQFNKMVKGGQTQYYLNELKFNGTETGIITADGGGNITGSLNGTYPLTITGEFTSPEVNNRLTFEGTVSGGFSGNVTGTVNRNGIDTLAGTITDTGATKTVRIIGIFPKSGTEGDFVGQVITDETTFVPITSISITGASSVNQGQTLTLGVTVNPASTAYGQWSTWEAAGSHTGSTIDVNTGVLTAGTPGQVSVIVKALDGSLLDDTKVITINDTVAPTLNVTGVVDGSTPLTGNMTDGYKLMIGNVNAASDHVLQFAAGTAADEPLKAEYFGLYLDPSQSSVSAAELIAYYNTRTTLPDAYRAYLTDAANGAEPFVYIKGEDVTLVDAAKHDLGAGDFPMTIPDDFTVGTAVGDYAGTYVVAGQIKDLAGNATPVTLKLIIERTLLARVNASQLRITEANKATETIGDLLKQYFGLTSTDPAYTETLTLFWFKNYDYQQKFHFTDQAAIQTATDAAEAEYAKILATFAGNHFDGYADNVAAVESYLAAAQRLANTSVTPGTVAQEITELAPFYTAGIITSENKIAAAYVPLANSITGATGLMDFFGKFSVALNALSAVNAATTTAAMRSALEAPVLGLNLTQYNTLEAGRKDSVSIDMLSNRPAGGFATVPAVQAMFDQIVGTRLVLQTSLNAVNGATSGADLADKTFFTSVISNLSGVTYTTMNGQPVADILTQLNTTNGAFAALSAAGKTAALNALVAGGDYASWSLMGAAFYNAILAQTNLEAATAAVVTAETSQTQADVISARALVNALPDGSDKTALSARLDAVQAIIDARAAALLVSNEAELRAALANAYVTQIQLDASFSLAATVNVERPGVSINGAGFTVTGPAKGTEVYEGHGFDVLANNVSFSELTITGSGRSNLVFYNVTGGVVTNVTLTNAANAGMIVNSSEVSISGVTTSGNGWGGINVDKKTTETPHLTVLNLRDHTSPVAYITPAIWVDSGNAAWVTVPGGYKVVEAIPLAFFDVDEYAAELAAELAAVQTGMTLTGSLSNLVATFPTYTPPAVFPPFVAYEPYKINSCYTLAKPLPIGTVVKVVRDGVKVFEGPIGPQTEFCYTDIAGGVPADFDGATYNGHTENYSIVVTAPTGLATDFDTTLQIQSVISKDNFTTNTVLDSITLDIHLDDNVAPAITSITAKGASGYGDVTAAGMTLNVERGYTVATIDIVMDEPVTVVTGTEVTLASVPYGLVAVSPDGLTVTVTPYTGNEVAGLVGTFNFIVPAGAVKDLDGNAWVNAPVILVVTDSVAPVVNKIEALSATDGNFTAVGTTLTVVEGYTVDTLEITLSEPVVVAAGTIVTMDGHGPYGTIEVVGNQLIVTPYPGNETAAEVGKFTFSVPAGAIADPSGNELAAVSLMLVVQDASFFVTQDFGPWPQETYPGWVNLGWQYLPEFDTTTIASIEIGMKDAAGELIVKYTASGDQIIYQRNNGYINPDTKQSSLPFYQYVAPGFSTAGEPILEGPDLDATVIKGPAFTA